MADTKISDLTVETTPPAATDHYVAAETDTTNTAVPASMVTLEHDTAAPVGSNVTAAIGKWYDLTIAGLTADRLFVLPDSVAVGSIVGFRVNDGDADYELKVATAASGSLLEGVDESAGSDEYCVFIAGESMKFRCIKNGGAGDTDWVVEYDGRISCRGEMFNDTAQSISAATWTAIEFTDSVKSRGITTTTSTPWDFTIRRTGRYRLTMHGSISSLDTNKYMILGVLDGTGTGNNFPSVYYYSPTPSGPTVPNSVETNLTAGDDIRLGVYHTDTVARSTRGVGHYAYPRMVIEEII